LKEVRDPRKRPEACTYPIEYILMLVLMMHCGQCGSRRQLGRDLAGKRFGGNIWRLVGKVYTNLACHPDTMNNVMMILDPEQLDMLIVKIVGRLRSSRALDKFRFDGKLSVAIDATGILKFNEKHCDSCTHQTSASGKKVYFHNVLAAKIVTPIGLVIPLAFEFIENPDSEYNKQDCEIKAARRLFEKIHRLYPRLQINLLADGLYAEQTTMEWANDLGWNFIITLTDDKLPSVTQQLPVNDEGWDGTKKATRRDKDGKIIHQRLRWKTPVHYHGEIYHVVELEETNQKGETTYYNKYITNVKPQRHNVLDLAKTGRLRWKIENEGTNTQKNGGYEMQHGFGLKGNAWKNYYLTLQIAQLMNDLVRFTDYIKKSTADPKATFQNIFGTIHNFAKRFIESLRNNIPRLEPIPKPIQIRFLLE